MKKLGLMTITGALALLTTTAWSGDEVDNPEKVVEYRHVLMEGVGKHMRASAMLVKGEVKSRKADMVLHASAMHHAAKAFPESLPKGTGPDVVKDTEALPEIWTDWEGFLEANKQFEEVSGKLLEAANAGDAEAFTANFKEVGKACKNCHDSYRLDEDE